MEFRILGPVEVAGAGRPIRLGSRRERAVLAALVIGGGDVVSTDRLIDALWGDRPPRTAGKTLQNYVLKLRKALGATAIETQAPGYRLATEHARIDARCFDDLVRAVVGARAEGRPAEAVELGREALGMWRGAPLEELTGWPDADVEAGRLAELRRLVAEEIVDAELACGRAAGAIVELEAMVAAEPLRERRWAMLMLALYREGRQAEALRTYQRARTLLGDELGIEPGPELRELERAVAAQDRSLDLAPVVPGATPIVDDASEEADDAAASPPYKGLAAFEPEDHDLFFGRAELVATLTARVTTSRFVAVTGPSGSGKSSVVRAGIVASLRADGRSVAVFTPGTDPTRELATALDATSGRTAAAGPPPVIVVDQFEEVFTRVDDPAEREQFVTTLLAAGTGDDPVTVVIAVRADFYGHCAAFPGLATRLDTGSVLLCAMTPAELRAAVEGPAAVAGLTVEPGLTELILRDTTTEPGALPLLSHALLETWRRRSRRTLTVAGYQDAGGVAGAIARTAESVYRGLDAADRRRARSVFLRLTELGDGTEDTSRRVARDEFVSAPDGPAMNRLLGRLADARLITVDDGSVRVAHEALLREWPRLRRWLDDDRDGRRTHRHLTEAAAGWDALGRTPTELYRGPRLAAAVAWVEHGDHAGDLNALEADFLRTSRAQEDAERARARSEQAARERTLRRTRWLLTATVIGLVVALVAGSIAFVQRNRADDASHAANVSRLVAQSAADRTEDPYLGALLALEANRARDDARTEGAVLASVLADPRRVRTLPTASSEGVWSLPGSQKVLVLSRGRLTVWDVGSGRRVRGLPVDRVQAAAVRPDGLTAVARGDGTVRFVDGRGSRTGPMLRTGMRGALANVAFSPDSRTLAVAYGNWADPTPTASARTVRLYDVATGTAGARIAGPLAQVTAAAFGPDGTLALGTADDHVVFRSGATGAATGPEIATPAPVTGLTFDPTRDRLAIGTTGAGVQVVSATTGAPVAQLVDAPAIDVPQYDPTGTTLAVGGDGPVRLYDAATLAPQPNRLAASGQAVPTGEPLDAQATPSRVSFTGRGRLVIGGASGPATVWDPAGISTLDRTVPGAPSYVFPMVGGKVLAVPDLADSVTLVDARTLRPLGPPLTPGPGATPPVVFPTTFAASYHHGDRIAVVNRSGALQLFDVATRRPLGPKIATGVVPVYAVFSRDMRTIAVGGRRGEVRLVDVASGRVRALPSPMTNYVLGLAFGPHDVLAASDAGHAVVYRDVRSAHPVARNLTPTLGSFGLGMDLSPDGRTLAMSTGDGVAFYDRRTLRRLGPVVPAAGRTINWVAYDRTGTRVVTGDTANRSRLIDVPGRQPIGPVLSNNVAGSGSVFSHDGRTLGTWTVAGGALLSLDPAVWRREACRLAGRNLTAAEWARYLPGQGARQRTCPQYP